MWEIKNENWHKSHTALSKYFIEKIKQRVDSNEIISNRHRTTNGFTLINEIVEVISITVSRKKSLNRLLSLLDESKNKLLGSSIVNDPILLKYDPDIISFVEKIPTTIRENDLHFYQHSFELFYSRLKSTYYKNIESEFKLLNFDGPEFDRTSRNVDKLIDCLIPYLLHVGFSTQSISEIAFWYVRKPRGNASAEKLLRMFSRDSKGCKFLFIMPPESEEVEFLIRILNLKGGDIKTVNFDDIGNLFLEEPPVVEDNKKLYEVQIDEGPA